MKATRPGYVDNSIRDPAELLAEDYSVALGHDPADVVAAFSEGGASLLADFIANQPAWMTDAMCRNEPVAVFFAGHGEKSQLAYELCSRCEVRRECLEYAIDEGIAFGIWGGASPAARRAVRRTNGDKP